MMLLFAFCSYIVPLTSKSIRSCTVKVIWIELNSISWWFAFFVFIKSSIFGMLWNVKLYYKNHKIFTFDPVSLIFSMCVCVCMCMCVCMYCSPYKAIKTKWKSFYCIARATFRRQLLSYPFFSISFFTVSFFSPALLLCFIRFHHRMASKFWPLLEFFFYFSHNFITKQSVITLSALLKLNKKWVPNLRYFCVLFRHT